MATLSLQAEKETPTLTPAPSPTLAPIYVVSLGVPLVFDQSTDLADMLLPHVQQRLKEAHLIYCPQSELSGRGGAAEMLSAKASQLRPFPLLMRKSQQHTNEKVYEEVATEIAMEVRKGKKVCLACMGDVSLYASASYVSKKLQVLGLDVRHEPNTSALHTAAALHQLSLVQGEENMWILSRCESRGEFHAQAAKAHTVVIFKPRRMWHWLAKELNTKTWKWYYTEHMGTRHMFLTTQYAKLRDRKIPYFAILILKRC